MPKMTLKAFLGPAYCMPSPRMEVTDEEAAEIVEVLEGLPYNSPVWSKGRYTVRIASDTDNALASVGLFHGEQLVGFYESATLWIAPAHRRKGLSTPLIVETAKSRGNVLHPDPSDFYGFSPIGLKAHKRAYRALRRAQLLPDA